MSETLSSATRRQMRKDLVRLRMELNRQQLRYHAQPVTNPLQHLKQWATSGQASGHSSSRSGAKTPVMIAAGLLLTLFGKRLGTFGRLARTGLALYPIVRSLQSSKSETVIVEKHR